MAPKYIHNSDLRGNLLIPTVKHQAQSFASKHEPRIHHDVNIGESTIGIKVEEDQAARSPIVYCQMYSTVFGSSTKGYMFE